MKNKFYSIYRNGTGYGIYNADSIDEAVKMYRGVRLSDDDDLEVVDVSEDVVKYLALCKIYGEDTSHYTRLNSDGYFPLADALRWLVDSVVDKYGFTAQEIYDWSDIGWEEAEDVAERCNAKLAGRLNVYDYSTLSDADYDGLIEALKSEVWENLF